MVDGWLSKQSWNIAEPLSDVHVAYDPPCRPPAVLYFLLQVSFLVDEGVSPVLLQLLSCALCGSKVLMSSSASSAGSSGGGSSSQSSQSKSSSKKSKKEDKEKEKDGKRGGTGRSRDPEGPLGRVSTAVWLPDCRIEDDLVEPGAMGGESHPQVTCSQPISLR